MSRFAKGMVPGALVKRGESIGYIGSTGLATGPHVCFRFWKNGKQVDHLRQNFPPPDPMPEEYLPSFYETRDNYVKFLDQVPVIKKHVIAVSNSKEDSNT
jgi:murein DD-endopeptidase MepM/ murein hydrolase activator NlpD